MQCTLTAHAQYFAPFPFTCTRLASIALDGGKMSYLHRQFNGITIAEKKYIRNLLSESGSLALLLCFGHRRYHYLDDFYLLPYHKENKNNIAAEYIRRNKITYSCDAV